MAKKNGTSSRDKPLRKVKTGCITCKRRKIKCDESWPICTRCSTTGRNCDGYGVWGGGSRCQHDTRRPDHSGRDVAVRSPASDSSTAVTTPPKSMPLMNFRAGESETFEWFINRSAIKLPGTFQCAQWTAMLFQSSMTEPAIRHAVLALGSAHKEEVQGAKARASQCDDSQAVFTVTQYNRAIKHLQHCFNNCESASTRVALLSCSLFVWMEFLRENYANGMLHLEYGLGLLREVTLSGVHVRDQDPWSSYVHGWVITIFTRALVQAKLFGQFPKLLCGNYLDLDVGLDGPTFKSVHHARRSLEHIMLQSMDLQVQWSHLPTSSVAFDNMMFKLLEDRTNLQRDLQLWVETYQNSIRVMRMSASTNENILERFALRLLRLYYRVAVIMVDTCLDADESGYDRHEAEFLTIISNCLDTYTLVLPKIKQKGVRARFHHDPEHTSPNSTSDIGWIPPLYFTAIKCRNHRIRQQAINLLQLSPHKEGIWEAMLAVMVAKKVVQIEEGTFYDYMEDKEQVDKVLVLPTKAELAADPVLPWAYRVSGIEVLLPEGRSGRPMVRCHRTDADGGTKWIEAECDIGSRYAFDSRYSRFSHTQPKSAAMTTKEQLSISDFLDVL